MKKDKSTRIAIIGAGPSGLAAAYQLKKMGYFRIVIFEKTNRVGGMTYSKTYTAPDGQKIVYDLGSFQPFGSKHLFALLKKFHLHLGIHGKRGKPTKIKVYSLEKRDFIFDFSKYVFGVPFFKNLSILSDIKKLILSLIKYRRLLKPGFGHTPYLEELSQNYQNWILNQDFKIFSPVLQLFGCAGLNCGSPEKKNDHSTLQFLKGISYEIFSRWQRYIRGVYLPVTEGYQELWRRIAEDLNIHLSSQIEKIERTSGEKIHIQTVDGSFEFDELIIACPPNKLVGIVDFDPNETEIFKKIKFSPGWTFALLAKNLPEEGLFVILEAVHSLGHSPVYTFTSREKLEDGSFLCHGIIGTPLTEGFKEIQSQTEAFFQNHFGARDIVWLDKVYWPDYNAHFNCEDVASGIFDRFEALQGNHQTYYTGELLSGGANAMSVDYSFDLVKSFF